MTTILNKINSPADLKELEQAELKSLADEIRELLIQTVSVTGGHLAPNLGVVELTIALHRVFDGPKDKIIWDVGHQCYTHKIITGRRKVFSKLRQFDGISGFPKREESVYDVFNTGHASTSISAASGMVIARDLAKENYKIIALIGDGALTGGMALEGLNFLGDLKSDIIIIFNNNKYSISPVTGAFSKHLNKYISSPLSHIIYNNLKEFLGKIISFFPGIGDIIINIMQKIEDKFKKELVSGGILEHLGFKYIGPINGHNLGKLIKTFKKVKELKGPIFIHIYTQKGKGFLPAEKNPSVFHSCGPFDITTGRLKKKEISYSEIVGETLVEICKENEKVFGITAAMSEGTGLYKLKEVYPNKFFDVGICEEHAVTMAAGMANSGLRPVVCIYSTFLQRAYDQILHDVCLQNLPVIFMLDRAGIVGGDGETHQGIFDIAYLRHLPNMIIMSPADTNELIKMLKFALTLNKPIAIRYPKSSAEKFLPNFPLKLGKMQPLILNKDSNCTILALGSMVKTGLDAVKLLLKERIKSNFYNVRFVKPLDEEFLLNCSGKIITIEEHIEECGFGSLVLEFLNQKRKNDIEILRIGLKEKIIPCGSREELLQMFGLTKELISERILKWLKNSNYYS